MTMSEEIVEYWRSVLLRIGTEEQKVAEFVREFRQSLGGERHYVGKQEPPEKKSRRLGECVAAGMSVRDAIRATGLPNATGYRLVSRRW